MKYNIIYIIVLVCFIVVVEYVNIKRVDQSIPLNIYITWYTENMPPKMQESVNKLVAMNPEFNVYLYDEDACIEFIEAHFDKDVVYAYKILKPGAYRADLWRYCILYKLGGVYLDIKFHTLVPLLPIVKKYPKLFTLDLVNTSAICKSKFSIYNGFMICKSGNKILKTCIDRIVSNCKIRAYKDNSLAITGPCLLGEAMMDNASSEYISAIYSKMVLENKKHTIKLNGVTILREYYDYRDEQKATQKEKHYGYLWKMRDIYN